MPGEPGGPVVTMLVCFVLFRTRGCGCIGRPAFPTPSHVEGEWFLQNSGPSRREIAEAYFKLERRGSFLPNLHLGALRLRECSIFPIRGCDVSEAIGSCRFTAAFQSAQARSARSFREARR